MWIEKKGRQYRVYWRNRAGEGPRRRYLPFASREDAEAFIALARLKTLDKAVWYMSDPSEENFQSLFGSIPEQAEDSVGAPTATDGERVQTLADEAVLGTTRAPEEAVARLSHLVEVTFEQLWERFLREQRHLEGTTREQYEGYYRNHFQPFFGGLDLGLIKRSKPLRESLALDGAVYVDDWVELMMRKEKLNNVHRPVEGSRLSYKTILNALHVLGQVFDVAVRERPALMDVNWAREIRLPKQDRREMHFLEDGSTFERLLEATHEFFRPLLTFLVGTGARFGEAAGLLARHVHLDAEKPYLEIRLILKWMRKKWRLGRPKTPKSVRRISLSPRLVELLRPLVANKSGDEHVFTMIEGSPLHHGNFYNRYFKPAVATAGGRVPAKLRIHDLRHTHAAWLLSSGAPIYVVMRRLGHSSSTTTLDVYGHLTPEADARTLKIVDRHLPRGLLDPSADAKVVRLTAREAALEEFDVDDLDDLAA